MQPYIYKITRLTLMPLIIVADFLQTHLTKHFTPMNMGPVSTDKFKKFLKDSFKKNSYILDFGCGVGYFSELFNPKKYIGIDINKNFIKLAKSRYSKYNFFNFEEKFILKNYKNKINGILINNVIHHLNNKQIENNFLFLKKNCKKNTSILIVEPLLVNNFFSVEFFMKTLDIGNYIYTKKETIKRLKKFVNIKNVNVKKFSIGKTLILKCNFKK